MDQTSLEQSLGKQRLAVEKILGMQYLPRFAAKSMLLPGETTIVQGVIGSGKTFAAIHAARAQGEPFAYVDLSDISLRGLDDTDYNPLIEGLMMVYGRFSVVIADEFLSHSSWRRCLNAFRELGVTVIALTSIFLEESAMPEYAHGVSFWPLSFSEYCRWRGVNADCGTIEEKVAVRKAFGDYMMRGGFPALQNLARPKTAAARLFSAIIKKNITGDFRKSAYTQIEHLAYYLLDHSVELLNYKRLAETLEIRSEVTVKKYIDAIKRSGAFSGMRRFAMRSKTRNVYDKLYLADPALIPSNDLEERLETVVYLQLRRFCERHGYFMHYYANRSAECNFALCLNRRMRIIIQVMADYNDSAVIKEKVAGLINLSKATRCNRLLILTDSSHDEIVEKGLSISVMPAYEFLLDEKRLIMY